MITKEFDTILTDEMRDYGFHLKEGANDFVFLYLGVMPVAVFTQPIVEGIYKEVNHIMKVILAFETTDKFVEHASEYCRDAGFKDPA